MFFRLAQLTDADERIQAAESDDDDDGGDDDDDDDDGGGGGDDDDNAEMPLDSIVADADSGPSPARSFSKGRVVGFPRRRIRHALIPLCTDSGDLHKEFVVPRSAVRSQPYMVHTFICLVKFHMTGEDRLLVSRARITTSSQEVQILATYYCSAAPTPIEDIG